MRVDINWQEGERYKIGLGRCSSAADRRIPVCILDKNTGKKYFRVGDTTENKFPVWIRFRNKRIQINELLNE